MASAFYESNLQYKKIAKSQKQRKVNTFFINCHVVSIKCRFDQMSFRSNVVSIKCRSIKCSSIKCRSINCRKTTSKNNLIAHYFFVVLLLHYFRSGIHLICVLAKCTALVFSFYVKGIEFFSHTHTVIPHLYELIRSSM